MNPDNFNPANDYVPVTIGELHVYKHKVLAIRAILECGTLYAVEVVCTLHKLDKTHLRILCDTIASEVE